MGKTLRLGLVIALGVGTLGLFYPANQHNQFLKVTKKVTPSVAKVMVPFMRNKKSVKVKGAGVFISKYGHVITAAHLFRTDSLPPLIKPYGSDVFHTGELLAMDKFNDIALVKIDLFTPFYAKLAPIWSLEVGEQIVTIGHPLGFDWSVSQGIISQLRDDLVFTQLIQTDTAMNPGNSGGPVFDLQGRVIGIASHGYSLSFFPVNSGLNMASSVAAIHNMLFKFKGLS